MENNDKKEQKPSEQEQNQGENDVKKEQGQEQKQLASDTSALMLELEGRINAKFENFKKEILSQKVETKAPENSKKVEEEW